MTLHPICYNTCHSFHYVALMYNRRTYIVLHCVTCIALRYIALDIRRALRYITLRYMLHYVTLHYVTLQYVMLCYVMLRYVTLCNARLHYLIWQLHKLYITCMSSVCKGLTALKLVFVRRDEEKSGSGRCSVGSQLPADVLSKIWCYWDI